MNKSIWPEQDPTTHLLDGAREGDSEAVEQLLARYRESLRRMIDLRLDKRVSQRVDVSDVVQDVLIEAHRRLQVYLDNPIMPFHLWIRQIAQDRLIDAHRRHRASAKRSVDRERRLEIAGPPDASTLELAGQLMDPELTPAARATQRELAERVQECIARLEQKDQDILLMRHYELLSNQEVATVLGLTEPAASMRYLRALKRLKTVIQSSPTDSVGYPQE
jgi:RNA polymerase sigma-70 factor, ECF subfamily